MNTGAAGQLFTAPYRSPLGEMLIASNGAQLLGVWFLGQKHFPGWVRCAKEAPNRPELIQTKIWLERYFAADNHNTKKNFNILADKLPPLQVTGTDFSKRVWRLIREIAPGTTSTYGQLGQQLQRENPQKRVSAQAVGAAVGRNPFAILVPCHRVIGADGRLTGYAGGIDKKLALLRLEGVNVTKF